MQKQDRALLVALNYRENIKKTQTSIDELEELARAVGILTIDKVIQSSESIDPRFLVGSGKIQEIKKMIDVLNIDIVIFDDTLSAGQLRNIEKTLEVQIMDRSFLILQIFAERAKTKQAILEVALAQKLYLLPRLIGMSKSLSRQGGGSFNAKGPGETKLELDRRRLTDEIVHIKRELQTILKERLVNQESRIDNQIPVVALVGYTNAGKSSLMNYLATEYGTDKTKVFEENMLFATLDTKAKRIKKENHPPFILIDTVGFISKLPPELITSFESTLSDIKTADLILHVVDGLNTSKEHIDFTRNILAQLGAETTPRILVVTKADIIHSPIRIQDEYLLVSNKTGENMDELYRLIDTHLYPDSRIFSLKFPFDQGSLYAKLKDTTRVLDTNYADDGILVRAVLTPSLAKQLHEYIK